MEAVIILWSKPEDGEVRVSFGQLGVSNQHGNGKLFPLVSGAWRFVYLDPIFGCVVNFKYDRTGICWRYNPRWVVGFVEIACMGPKFSVKEFIEVSVTVQILDKQIVGRDVVLLDEMGLKAR
jgi:hypothetical protein